IKSNYMRNPMAAELFNEEVCNLLKTNIRSTVTRIDDLGIEFDYDGSVEMDKAALILERASSLHTRVIRAADASANAERASGLRSFAASLEKTFYGFEADFFQQNVARIVDDVISTFKGSLELWPTLVEITYLHKRRVGLPLVRVNNPHRRPTISGETASV
ncbi:MAG TPA: hypothetical protein VF331_26465, partial [Polyangiales bacterium]